MNAYFLFMSVIALIAQLTAKNQEYSTYEEN